MTLQRLNWQKWLFVGGSEAQAEQANWIGRVKGHQLSEHSAGISAGATVIQSSPTSLHVKVQTGRVVDPVGNVIIIESIADIDLSSYAVAGGLAYIVAEYHESQSGAYFVPETGDTLYRYYQETPLITHQASAPTGNQVELARVNVGASATQITNAASPRSPATNEINQTHRVMLAPRLFGSAPQPGQSVVFAEPWASSPVDDFAPGWPAGWKVLFAERGSIVAQLTTLGVAAGDKFMLMPGSYTLGGDLTISATNVQIVGSGNRAVTVDVADYTLTLSGSGCRITDMTLQPSGAATADNLLYLSGSYDCIGERLIIDGTAELRKTVVWVDSVRGGLIDCTLAGCTGYDTGNLNVMLQLNRSDAKAIRCRFSTPTTSNLVSCIKTTSGQERISQCYFDGNGMGNFSILRRCVWAASDDVAVNDCTFNFLGVSVGATGVFSNTTHKTLSVSGCVFDGMVSAVTVSSTASLATSVSGCSVKYLVSDSAYGLSVVGFSMSGTGSISGCSLYLSVASTSFSAYAAGIGLNASSRFEVSGCNIEISAKELAYGIDISGGEGHSIDGNTINVTGVQNAWGIIASDVVTSLMISNNDIKVAATGSFQTFHELYGIKLVGTSYSGIVMSSNSVMVVTTGMTAGIVRGVYVYSPQYGTISGMSVSKTGSGTPTTSWGMHIDGSPTVVTLTGCQIRGPTGWDASRSLTLGTAVTSARYNDLLLHAAITGGIGWSSGTVVVA